MDFPVALPVTLYHFFYAFFTSVVTKVCLGSMDSATTWEKGQDDRLKRICRTRLLLLGVILRKDNLPQFSPENLHQGADLFTFTIKAHRVTVPSESSCLHLCLLQKRISILSCF